MNAGDVTYHNATMGEFDPRVCNICGSWVIDADRHSRWHSRAERSQPERPPALAVHPFGYQAMPAEPEDDVDNPQPFVYPEIPAAPPAREGDLVTECHDLYYKTKYAAKTDLERMREVIEHAFKRHDAESLDRFVRLIASHDFDFAFKNAVRETSARLLGRTEQG